LSHAEIAMTLLDPILTEPAPAPHPVSRGLTMVGYLCLFFTVFFLGIPAFIALILAKVREGDVDPVTDSHLRFQIRIFWWAFSLSVISAVGLMASLILGIGRLITREGHTFVMPDGRLLNGDTALAGLGIASVGAGLLACLWTWLGSLWGGLRLAGGHPIGRL
jgi:uncharacterized membrane protein